MDLGPQDEAPSTPNSEVSEGTSKETAAFRPHCPGIVLQLIMKHVTRWTETFRNENNKA